MLRGSILKSEKNDSELKKIFKFPVVEIRFVTDHETGQNRDYAFVEFESEDFARKEFEKLSLNGLNKFGNAQIKFKGEPL